MSMIYEEGPERINELPPAVLALRNAPWRPLLLKREADGLFGGLPVIGDRVVSGSGKG